MKKLILGLLIVAALSACSSSEEKVDLPTQVQTLNETVEANATTLSEIKSENEMLKSEVEKTKKDVDTYVSEGAVIKQLEDSNMTATKTESGLDISLPTDSSFKLNQSELNDSAKAALDSIAKLLQEYPDSTVLVRGHTDNTGSDEINEKVSLKRAQSVSDYLVSKDIVADRITTEAKGSSQPVGDNETKEGRAANRRVDVSISY